MGVAGATVEWELYTSPIPNKVITSDASNIGWGAAWRGQSTSGRWTNAEHPRHINFKELLAAFLALKSFLRDVADVHVLFQCNNSAAVAYLNKQGGTASRELSNLAIEIWEWCLERNISLQAIHLPGVLNTIAALETRLMREASEWQLDPSLAQVLYKRLLQCSVDLFATRNNAQLPLFFSWRPDPEAQAIDAFAQNWSEICASRRGLSDRPSVADAGVVAVATTAGRRESVPAAPVHPSAQIAERGSPPPDQQQNVVPIRMADIGRYWEGQGFTRDAAAALLSSWASGTRKQYDSALKKWHCWCMQRRVDTLLPSVKDVANFLVEQQRAGLQYNSIAVIKSAVSTVLDSLNDQTAFTGDARIAHVMKGLFRMAPPLPKHSATWDVTIVLNALKAWGHSETLTDKLLSLKLTMLLALCSPKRVSEVANLWLSCMRTFGDRVVFTLPGMTKNRGSGPPHEAIYSRFPITLLCPVHTLNAYIARTSGWRGMTDKLLLSYVGRHQAIGPASVARWICTMLAMSGVDTRFTAHSTRSAATSKADRAGLSAAQIMVAVATISNRDGVYLLVVQWWCFSLCFLCGKD
uniref:Integrase n=1 Tax=Plectus sambesii TaxID=2011161 RepID=A0A914XGI4_9BILA